MKRDDKLSRRKFVRTIVGSTAIAGIASKLKPLEVFADAASPESAMPTRPLGSTGYSVWIFSLGEHAIISRRPGLVATPQPAKILNPASPKRLPLCHSVELR